MADNAGDKPLYTIIKVSENNLQSNSSRDYTGKGLVTYPTGDLYEGFFVEGVRQGQGTYTYVEKNEKYEGEWHQNKKHGIGKFTYVDGEYFGRFENGQRHGEGVFTYKTTKDIYSGSWKHGKKHGRGTFIFTDKKTKIVGNWVNGEIVEGDWVFQNGTFFRGKFSKNKPSGYGVWHFANGNVVKGTFNQVVVEENDETKININWTTDNEVMDPTRLKESI